VELAKTAQKLLNRSVPWSALRFFRRTALINSRRYSITFLIFCPKCLPSRDKRDRFFMVIKFWMDETSGVALALKNGVPTYQRRGRPAAP
jgi:hypothetical protein